MELIRKDVHGTLSMAERTELKLLEKEVDDHIKAFEESYDPGPSEIEKTADRLKAEGLGEEE